VPDPSSRHPAIREISCSWEGHDFSRAIKNQKKDSGTANPPDRTESRSPAHLSSNSSAALSIISQVMESFSILTLP
jgi:hypothetical protein